MKQVTEVPTMANDGVFPLAMAPFEAMALYDNWKDYPMSCGAIFTLRGVVNRTAFDHALKMAARRHPLVSANLRRSRMGRLKWVPSANDFKPRWIGTADATDFAASQPYDLSNEPGVRIWVQQRGEVARVFVEFHHACCDGAGGMSFMDDVFALYASQTGSATADLPPLEMSRLKSRGKFASEGGTFVQRLQNHAADLGHSLTMALRQPQPVAAAGGSHVLKRQTWSADRFITRRLGKSMYQSLRAAAVSQSVTLNDFLVSRLFLTLRLWNERYQPNEKGWLRILIPVNLRNRSDLSMPLTNRLSYGFITRRSEEVLGDSSLTQSVSAENARLRRIGLPRRLLQKFALMQCTGLWPLVFSKKRCLATAVFSNLGDPTRRFRTRFPRESGSIRIGDVLMTGFEGTTALRPMTRVGVFMNTFGNEVTISTRLDPRLYSVADADAFLDLFMEQILSGQASQRRAA